MAKKSARINIEVDLFTRGQWFELILKTGSADTALGALARCWIVAQKYWFPEKLPIPKDVWVTEKLNPAVIEVGLAEVRTDGIYVRGSAEQFSWLFDKSDAGKASAESRKKRDGTAQPGGKKQKKPRKKTERRSNTVELAFDSESNSAEAPPPPLSPPLSPVLVPAVADSCESGDESPEKNKGQFLIAKYCQFFKRKHGSNPEILGKQQGVAKRLAENLSKPRIELLVEAFFLMPDAWLHKTRHPLEALETKINEVVVFAESGSFTTSRQAQQADDQASNHMLLANIRSQMEVPK